VGDSKTGETVKYDGIYYLIQYLRKAPKLLRFINVGNKDVKLNLVPVDFVVEAMASLSDEEKAVGKTIALADPSPLTTAELFDAITEEMTGKKSTVTPSPALVERSLMLGVSPGLTVCRTTLCPIFFFRKLMTRALPMKSCRSTGSNVLLSRIMSATF
jgi:hypothetical protein